MIVNTILDEPITIGPDEVDDLLDRAETEQWQTLTLFGTGVFLSPPQAGDVRLRGLVDAESLVSKLSRLTALTSLGLVGLKIGADGARALTALTGLTSLNLWSNEIGAEVARALAALTGLTSLDLRDNRIGDEGARALAALTGLTSLDLRDNRIGDEGARALLDAWADAAPPASLRSLDLRENGDLGSVLPPEVLDTDDAQAVLAAYRRFRRDAGLRPLNEAKLLVVGEEASGKTSLIRYLVHDQPRDPNEVKTPGIRMYEKIETQDWSPDAGGLRLNVWDFGGQAIMRGTHRFFLTERSLYLLVLENRFEDDVQKVYEWLETIRIRSGGSPVLVVISKCDRDRPYVRKDDEIGLRDTYPNIVGFIRTACNDDAESRASIANLNSLIAETIAEDKRLKHVREPTAASWLRVKDAVRNLASDQSILTYAEFQRICAAGADADNSVTDPNELRALLRLLHDLGTVVAHGFDRDSPAVRREVTLLDPNWLTEAIYPVLDRAAANPKPGEFSRSQLADWLDPHAYPPERHEFILDRMMDPDIGLAAPLPATHGQRYLVPRALPPSPPYYDDIWPADSIRFRFRHDLLPDAFFPRFIVEAHRELADPPTRWQTGAVLKIEGCPVLVKADRQARTIDVLVDGRSGRGRDALAVVRRHLKAVHEQLPETMPVARVPLPDRPEVDVSYDHLRTLEEMEGTGHEFLPEGAARKYTVRELLDGVRLTDRSEWELSRSEAARHSIEASENALGAQAVKRGHEPTTEAKPQQRDYWPWLAAGCGVFAIIAAAILIPFDWNAEWRFAVGTVLAVGFGAWLLVLSLNPRRYFRWALSAWLAVGSLHAGGISFALDAGAGTAEGFVRWGSQPSATFLVVWAVVVFALIAADLIQQRWH